MTIYRSTINFRTGTANHNFTEGSSRYIFEGVIDELCKEIKQANVVFGDVMSVTSKKVISALEGLDSCQLVLNKKSYGKHHLYSRIRCLYTPRNILYNLEEAIDDGSWDDDLESIRYCGSLDESEPALMHNKIIVLAKIDPRNFRLDPYAVWSGSCNFSFNASRSFENAIITYNRKVAVQYYKEYKQILARSESIKNLNSFYNPQWVNN